MIRMSPAAPSTFSSGANGAELGAYLTLGYLSQSLATCSGQKYLVSCWFASPDGQTPNEFSIAWNGSTLLDGKNVIVIAWTNLQFMVTASSSNTLLQFGFRDNPSFLGLDNISVVPVSTNPPTIALQPTNQTVSAGGTAVFASFAWGAPPLACQWQRNATNLAGATNGNLTLSGVTTNQAGTYRLVVTSMYGSATSSSAVLTVTPMTATFTASPTNGTTPLIVTFTDTSAGTITNRYWSFGDGDPATRRELWPFTPIRMREPIPCQLVISGPAGSAASTQTNCIVAANPPPPGIPTSAWIGQYYPGTPIDNYASLAASNTGTMA